VKYTVPPETFVPLPVVGAVRPGPDVGRFKDTLELELPEFELLEPQALTTSAITTATARAAGSFRQLIRVALTGRTAPRLRWRMIKLPPRVSRCIRLPAARSDSMGHNLALEHHVMGAERKGI
jgi:hypothetical protein